MLGIKEKILSYYTQRLVESRKTIRANVGFTNAQLLGILYSHDHPHKYEAVLRFTDKAKRLGKQVAGLCYVTEPAQASNSAFPAVTHRDVKVWGTISHPQAKHFVNTPFDYLYHAELVSNPVLDYLLAKSQAKCRVGYFDPARAGLFEMMVTFDKKADSNEIDDLAAQMLHYTQLLKA